MVRGQQVVPYGRAYLVYFAPLLFSTAISRLTRISTLCTLVHVPPNCLFCFVTLPVVTQQALWGCALYSLGHLHNTLATMTSDLSYGEFVLTSKRALSSQADHDAETCDSWLEVAGIADWDRLDGVSLGQFQQQVERMPFYRALFITTTSYMGIGRVQGDKIWVILGGGSFLFSGQDLDHQNTLW